MTLLSLTRHSHPGHLPAITGTPSDIFRPDHEVCFKAANQAGTCYQWANNITNALVEERSERLGDAKGETQEPSKQDWQSRHWARADRRMGEARGILETRYLHLRNALKRCLVFKICDSASVAYGMEMDLVHDICNAMDLVVVEREAALRSVVSQCYATLTDIGTRGKHFESPGAEFLASETAATTDDALALLEVFGVRRYKTFEYYRNCRSLEKQMARS